MSLKSGVSKRCALVHMQGGADSPQQELLRKLSVAGVPLAHLQLLEPRLATLQPAQVVELCRRAPRLMHVQGEQRSNRGSVQSAEVLALMAARREAHRARLGEYMNALRPLPAFRTRLPLLQRVLSFLAAGQRANATLQQTARMQQASCTFVCVAHGCRLKVSDIMDFLVHVLELHM